MFKATSLASGKDYALKIIPKNQLRKSKDKIKQLINEVSIVKRILHENIIRYYTHFETPEEISIVFEIAEQGNLYCLLRKRIKLEEPEVAKYGF